MGASTSTSVIEFIAPTSMMNTEMASRYLGGIKPATLAVWRSTNRQRLAFVKVGGRVFYRKADLDAFIAANLRNAPRAS